MIILTSFRRNAARRHPGSAAAEGGDRWRNPSGSVHVRVHPCGEEMCGTVIWANERARADSARGGTPNLVGTQLPQLPRHRGERVDRQGLRPDLNRTFTGTGRLVDGDTLVARGCLAGNFGCRSQTSIRIR